MRSRLILAGALTAAATAAMAQPPAKPAPPAAAGAGAARVQSPLAEDVRCALVMNAAGRQPQATPQVKEIASQAMIYFVGRVDGRGAADRLKMLLEREAAGLTPQLAQAEFARCGQAFQARVTQLRTMGGTPAAPAPKR